MASILEQIKTLSKEDVKLVIELRENIYREEPEDYWEWETSKQNAWDAAQKDAREKIKDRRSAIMDELIDLDHQ